MMQTRCARASDLHTTLMWCVHVLSVVETIILFTARIINNNILLWTAQIAIFSDHILYLVGKIISNIGVFMKCIVMEYAGLPIDELLWRTNVIQYCIIYLFSCMYTTFDSQNCNLKKNSISVAVWLYFVNLYSWHLI